jgi:hypothetical protein
MILSFSLFNVIGGQKELIEKRKAELHSLSEAILKKIKNIEKYNNKKIYIKAKVLPKGDSTYEFLINKVSLNEFSSEETPVDPDDISTDKFIYLEGEVYSSPDESFSLDIKDVLPPEKNKKIDVINIKGTET